MKLLSIASGSSGNCIYIGNDNTHILIDVGISGKRVEAGLNSLGLSVKDITAIFITHEHLDHISGLGVLSRKCSAEIYATEGTVNAIFKVNSLGVLQKERFNVIQEDNQICIDDIIIEPMKISHDAIQPVAYRCFCGDKKIAIATDMGYPTKDNEEKLKGMDAILIESNHDVNMLSVGPYPYKLKQRILGKLGHLSNETAGKLIDKIADENLKYILLGHLSKDNNMPALAYEAVRLEITMSESTHMPSDFDIRVARRSEPSELITI